jgi:hypothetical protein
MGKRQKRYTGSDLSSPELIGSTVNLIKTDGSVLHIKILEITSHSFVGKDLRGNKYKISVKDVYEIITDLVSTY